MRHGESCSGNCVGYRSNEPHEEPQRRGRSVRKAESTNDLYAEITRVIFDECEGAIDDFATDDITGDVVALPHRLVCATSTMSESVTDLTVHLWEDIARVVIYRDWNPDTALVGTVGYGPDFGDNLRLLIQQVEQRLRAIPDPQQAIDSLVMD